MSERVLCVDDDANILNAYKRSLRKAFSLDTALGAEEAIAAIKAKNAYAVIVSDMRMPGMDGIQLLSAVRMLAPNTVRIMLTGFAELQTAVDAVNEGHIFRFLTKPCPPESLARALADGIQQYRLITAEKELLERTLAGSVKVLIEVLSLTNPIAFGQASRVRPIVRKLCDTMHIDRSWQIEVATLLSQIGCVAIPPDTLERAHHTQALSPEEENMLAAHPSVGQGLVAKIPRLDEVAAIIAHQHDRFDTPQDEEGEGGKVPYAARILKVALDYDRLKTSGVSDTDAVFEMRDRKGAYCPDVIAALESVANAESASQILDVMIRDLASNMVLADDIKTPDGTLVVSKGQAVTPSLRERLNNFARTRQLVEPVHVIVQSESSTRADSATARR